MRPVVTCCGINPRFPGHVGETASDAKVTRPFHWATLSRLILKTIILHAKRIGPTLIPDRSRVLLRPFRPSTDDISRRIVARVMALPEEEIARLLAQVIGEFSDRHERVEDFFRKRFAQVKLHLEPDAQPSPERQLLIGAHFTHEYSP